MRTVQITEEEREHAFKTQRKSESIEKQDARIFLVTNKRTADGHGYQAGIEIKKISGQQDNESNRNIDHDQMIDLAWPDNIFALSHVCIPIPPDDPVYGRNSILGGINVKGEKEVLFIGDDLARLRYNPFFEIIERRLEVFIEPSE